MKNKIKSLKENIQRLETTYEGLSKIENYDPNVLSNIKQKIIEYQYELQRLTRLEWQEKYERLDFGDDR